MAETPSCQSAPCQTLPVVQDANTVSVAGLNGAPMQWSTVGGQNAIITLHTLPFMEGGQGITITETGVNFDPSLVQTLISQTVGVKTEEASAGGLDGMAGAGGQIMDFGPAPAPVTSLIDVEPGPSEAGTGDTEIGQAESTQMLPSQMAVSLESVSLPSSVEISDDTPIFNRVCATLNPNIMNTVPGAQDFLIEQLNLDDVHLGINEDRLFTLETTFSNLVTVHNRLKDLLNLPSYTKLTSHSSPRPPPAPSPPPSPPLKKTENVGVSCQLLVPFVSSKGRSIRVPGNLQGALNNHDYTDSDDGEEEVRKYTRKKRGCPRKSATVNVIHTKIADLAVGKGQKNTGPAWNYSQHNAVNSLENDGGSDNEVAGKDEGTVDANGEDTENIVTFIQSQDNTTVLRKSRRNKHETKATHMRRIYEGRVPFKFFCDKCSFKSKRESHFLKHMKHHEIPGTDLHKCSECDFKTIRLSHLRRHELLHKKSLVKCEFCGYITDSSQQLMRHMKLKHPHGANTPVQDKPYRCDICGRSLSSRVAYTQHLLKHAEETNTALTTTADGTIKCSDCPRTFLRRVHYDRHRRDVHGPQLRPHLCDICGKAFKRTDALQQHKMVHMSQTARVYPVHCRQCNKGFRSQAHLNEHMTMHSTDRPYLCQYCGSAFKTPSVQKKHILSLHLKPRSYSCDTCDKKFNTRSALQRHNRMHEMEAQKLAVAQSAAVDGGLVEIGIVEGEPLQQHADGAAAVVTVEEAAEVLQTQQQSLVQDVLASGMEESLEQGEVLQPQYIQGNETAAALFYLTGSL